VCNEISHDRGGAAVYWAAGAMRPRRPAHAMQKGQCIFEILLVPQYRENIVKYSIIVT